MLISHLSLSIFTHTRNNQRLIRFTPFPPFRSIELVLGALAAALAQLFTIPVSVIATRQQLATKNLSFRQTFQAILVDDGVTGLWRGLKPSLVLCINPAITYGMFERFKTLLLKEGEKMTPGKAFIIGALSKTMATVVCFSFLLHLLLG